jgi:hypothetical protein
MTERISFRMDFECCIGQRDVAYSSSRATWPDWRKPSADAAKGVTSDDRPRAHGTRSTRRVSVESERSS